MKTDINANNILVIDSEGNNESISYKKSDIDSYVPDFHVNYQEFLDIINEDFDEIYQVDTRDCIAIIDSNNNEISLGKYKPGIDIKFFKLSDDVLKDADCDFYVSTDLLYGNATVFRTWSDDVLYTPKNKLPKYKDNIVYLELQKMAAGQFDGYEICKDIMNNKNADNAFAVGHCNGINISNGYARYHGFLPSVYQMGLLLHYLLIIEDFNKKFGINKKFNKMLYMEAGLWTCNEMSLVETWEMDGLPVSGNRFGPDCHPGYKNLGRYVFPVFKKIN